MLRSSIISSSADTLILTLFSLLHVCVCVCVLGMWGRSQCSSAAQSVIILPGAEAVSHTRFLYLPVRVCLREKQTNRDMNACLSACIHSMTPTMHNSAFLDALERCLLSLSCLVLSYRFVRRPLAQNLLLLPLLLLLLLVFHNILYTTLHLTHLSPPPYSHGPTELGVVLPSLQEVMASESNSTFSACMPKSKSAPTPASAPTSPRAPVASGSKDSVGTVMDMEGGLFGTGD